MGLPYPQEIESGRLRSDPRPPHAPFDVAAHLADAIVAEGERVRAFGVPLRPVGGAPADEAAEHLQRSLLDRFNERRPDADGATWALFASQARGLLERRERLDEQARRALLLAIDGL